MVRMIVMVMIVHGVMIAMVMMVVAVWVEQVQVVP